MRCSSQFKLSCARAQQRPQPYLRAYYARSRTYARTSSAIYARTFRMLRPYPLRGTPVGVNLYARTRTRTTPVERFRFYRIYRTLYGFILYWQTVIMLHEKYAPKRIKGVIV